MAHMQMYDVWFSLVFFVVKSALAGVGDNTSSELPEDPPPRTLVLCAVSDPYIWCLVILDTFTKAVFLQISSSLPSVFSSVLITGEPKTLDQWSDTWSWSVFACIHVYKSTITYIYTFYVTLKKNICCTPAILLRKRSFYNNQHVHDLFKYKVKTHLN